MSHYLTHAKQNKQIINPIDRGVASSKHVRGLQLNNIMLTIVNVNQDIDTILKQDKSEGAMAPLGPIVATPVPIEKYTYASKQANSYWVSVAEGLKGVVTRNNYNE